MERTDRELLDAFLAGGDGEAKCFRILVNRYLGPVHSVARRVTGNDELARDVTQNTFIRLARRAAGIPRRLPLAAWLHRSARSLAIDAVRAEASRRRAEQRLAEMPATGPASSDAEWERLAPLVDALVQKLAVKDQEVLLMRFYRGCSHGEIGAALGLNEHAARQRVLRALEKLRGLLVRRGIAATPAGLGSLLEAHAAVPVPAGLGQAVQLAVQSLTPASTTGLLSSLLAMTTGAKLGVVAVAAVAFLLTAVSDRPGAPATPAAAMAGGATAKRAAGRQERWSPQDFVNRLVTTGPRLAREDAYSHALDDELNGWSMEELRQALREALASPEILLPNSDLNDLLGHLVGELMWRNHEEFVSWFESGASDAERKQLAPLMSRYWPASRGEEGYAFMKRHHGILYGSGRAVSPNLLTAVLDERAARGASAMGDLLRELREMGVSRMLKVDFPADFDFAALATSEEGRNWWRSGTGEDLVKGWLTADPEGAWRALVTEAPEGFYPPCAQLFAPEVSLSWLGEKVSAAAPEVREKLIAGGLAQLARRPGEAMAFALELSSPEDRQTVHRKICEQIGTLGVAAVLPHLEALGDPASRLTWLEQGARQLPLSPATLATEGEALREKLVEWQASPERIEAIFQRLQQPVTVTVTP